MQVAHLIRLISASSCLQNGNNSQAEVCFSATSDAEINQK